MKSRLLGGLTAREFLRGYWQKRPLLVRAAMPDVSGIVDREALAALAARDDVECRIVERRRGRREIVHGPFKTLKAKSSGWTLLVNGVNLHVAGAERLLQRFNFVPQARLDDVMVSYATPGGGVRAPRGGELAAAFLDWLHERGLPQADYRDPGLAPARRPGSIPEEMIAFANRSLKRIRWSRSEVERFLGEYLSEPKAHVVFSPGTRRRAIAGAVVRLDPKTRMLY